MPHSVFRYDAGGRLGAEGVDLETALAEAGAGTPAYIYSGPRYRSVFPPSTGRFAGPTT